ncbi:MAG: carbohydrate ABC transporter permease [Nitrososphaeria archaeon]
MNLKRILTYIILIIASFITIFPIYWMASLSLQPSILAWSFPPSFIFVPTLENYEMIFFKRHFDKWLLNSIVVTSGATSLSILLGLFAAYAFSRFKIKGTRQIAMWILSLRFFPPIVIILPLYILYSGWGIYDTFLGLILAHSTMLLPFSIWMLFGFLNEIPKELDEAAEIDGASKLSILFRILIPLSKAGIAATAILCAITSWNDFIFAFSLTSEHSKTLMVAISGLLGDYVWEWSAFYAAGTLSIFPMILLGLIAQRYLARGVTFGALKM